MQPRKLTSDTLNQIVNLRRAGVSFMEIAVVTGISAGAIDTWRKAGAKASDGLCRDIFLALKSVDDEQAARKKAQRQKALDQRIKELKERYA